MVPIILLNQAEFGLGLSTCLSCPLDGHLNLGLFPVTNISDMVANSTRFRVRELSFKENLDLPLVLDKSFLLPGSVL